MRLRLQRRFAAASGGGSSVVGVVVGAGWTFPCWEDAISGRHWQRKGEESENTERKGSKLQLGDQGSRV
jgi:hypothetical protein